MQINYYSAQLIILLIFDILSKVILCIAFITSRFNIVLSSSIEIE